MSFEQKALELLHTTETALGSLITEALRARAYKDVAAIAGLAEATAASRLGHDAPQAPQVPSADFAVAAAASGDRSSPSWMRRP